MQTSFFQNNENLLSKDGRVILLEESLKTDFEELKKSIEWKHEQIKLFGRWVYQPRLSAWYGDEGTDYQYSGLRNVAKPWIQTLLTLKQQVEKLSSSNFNSVLLNYYRDGQDSMGWHQDNEIELGHNPTIASLSFGEKRSFQLRHKFDKSLAKIDLALGNGSLLIMSEDTQRFWQHQIPKTKKMVGERINLTFRLINNNR